MDSKKRIWQKVWIVLVVAIISQFLFDPLLALDVWVENVEAQMGIPMARSKWEEQNISHYQFEIRAHQQVCWVIYARVEVDQGSVVQVHYIDFETGKTSRNSMPRSLWDQNPDWLPNGFLCNYGNFTMPQIFDFAERQLSFIFDISFDNQHGFITQVQFGEPNGNGLFNVQIGGCCTGLTIKNFEVLDE